jgi:hypothetical protein
MLLVRSVIPTVMQFSCLTIQKTSRGLYDLYSHGIIYHDMRSSNIRFNAQGHLKIGKPLTPK